MDESSLRIALSLATIDMVMFWVWIAIIVFNIGWVPWKTRSFRTWRMARAALASGLLFCAYKGGLALIRVDDSGIVLSDAIVAELTAIAPLGLWGLVFFAENRLDRAVRCLSSATAGESRIIHRA